MSTIVQTGFKLAQSVISNGAITGNQWTNPNNLLLVDHDISQSNPNNAASDVFIGNFNSDLPSNAVVTGIEIKVFGYRGAETAPPITLTPYALDNTSGSDVYDPYETPFTGLTEDYGEYVLGGPTYLFATDWTVDMINNFKLGLLANGDISLDAAQLNVYYYIPDTIVPPVLSGDNCSDCNAPIQVQPTYLALPLKATDTKCYLTSLNYPDGTPVQYEDLGACGGYIDITFDAGQPKQQGSNFEENAYFAVWTVLPSGIVEVDFGTIENRGRAFHTPYGHDDNLLSDHDANSIVLISNSGHYENRFVRKCQVGSIFSSPITVDNQDSPLVDPVTELDFRGSGVVVVNDGTDTGKKIITIPGAGGSSTPVSVSTGSGTSGNTQVSELEFEINITGINRGALVNISTEELQTVTDVTIDGVSASQLISETDTPNNLRTEQWGLVAPNLGTVIVHISLSGPAYICAGAENYINVDQTSPFGVTNSNSGSSLSPLIGITTTVDNSIIVDSLVTAMTPILYTPGVGQTRNWSHTANSDTRQGGSSFQLAGTAPDVITMNWAITQNTPWVITAIEVKGVVSSAGGDGKVKVDSLDTTKAFLTSKINIHSSDNSVIVTPSIINPSGNEILDFDLTKAVGGSILLQQTFLHTDFAPDGHGNMVAYFSGSMPVGAGPVGAKYDTTIPFDTGATVEVLDTDPSGQVVGSLAPIDAVAILFGETAGSAIFDWSITPHPAVIIPGLVSLSSGSILITIVGSGSSGQSAIQFEDQTGANLGTPGTATEFEITGGGVSGARSGNKVTYTLPAPTTPVTSVGATSPITSSGGTTPNISTSMATNKLIGRSTAGTGTMEEITIGSGLSLSGGTLSSFGSSGSSKLFLSTSGWSLGDNIETTIGTFTIAGGTLGTNNAVRFFVKKMILAQSNLTVTFRIYYGATVIGTIVLFSGVNLSPQGFLEGLLCGNGATNAQILNGNVTYESQNLVRYALCPTFNGSASEDSTLNQTFTVTAQSTSIYGGASGGIILVEKIS